MRNAAEKPDHGALRRAAERLAALALALCALACCGCADLRESSARFFAMDTFMELKAYGPGAEAALAEAEEYVVSLGALLSVTDENSEVYAIDHAGGAAVAVSSETFGAISGALDASRMLGEPFDITIYPVLRAWGFTASEYRVPDESELASLLELVDDSLIELDTERQTVRLPAGAELDLGAAAKGYAADACADIMRKNGVASALLNLGSSTICALGKKPDGSDWSIAVKDPFNTEGYAGKLTLSDAAVSTSGGYERYFTGDDGEIYWHILDPLTGRPAKSGLVSVTVISADALYGDCLSTALFVMGLERAEAFRQEHGGFEFIAVTEAGEIYLTPGAAEVFTPLGEYETRVKVIGA